MSFRTRTLSILLMAGLVAFAAAPALAQDTPTEREAAREVLKKMADLEKSLDVPRSEEHTSELQSH